MNPIAEDILMHYGTPRHSGRWPWGSGDNPYQHSGDFLSRVEELKKQGLSEKEIAKSLGMSTTSLREQKALAKTERKKLQYATAVELREKGYSNAAIAKELGLPNESSVRSLLNEKSEARRNATRLTADYLKEIVDKKGMVDVGAGVEKELDVTDVKLNQALAMLGEEGYPTYSVRVQQATNPGKTTTVKTLCPPGTKYKDVYPALDKGEISSVRNYNTILTEGGTKIRPAFVYPESMSSSRLKVRYAEEGGIDKDGVIEIRRGVKDLDLGNSHYAQVRIMVDKTHYLKGMAVYSDDMPDGVDVIFNTNKKTGTPALGSNDTVLKKIKNDPDNPFGSLIKEHGGQSYYDDPDGKYTDPLTGKKQSLSLINKRAEEGDWDEWGNKLPSQFLAKQNMSLINKQLGLAMSDKQAEFDDICSYNNPTVKKRMLQSFADDCDSAAVHLQAAALPRQRYQVILPLTSIKDNEVYAPNYKDGEQVALVRYPHGGTFEIPILTVNNKQREGKNILGNSLDAVGINSKVAERLSGADFDGDTVMVVPTGGKVKIKSTKKLEGLEGFDPKLEYGGKKEGTFKVMTKENTQKQMGIASNLIMDMTLRGAPPEDLAKAVKHSMVVIDAEKHKLDWKQSEIDNDIAYLKKKYQGRIESDGRYHEGAATLITKAKSEERVLKRRGQAWINEDTGELEWERVNPKTGEFESKIVREEYTNPKTGKKEFRTIKSTKMAETKDARTLISEGNTPQERAYAEYANKMKSLANQARKEMISTPNLKYSAAAKEAYKKEVASLDSKLNIALKNAPRERQAQIMANSVVKAKKQADPDIDKKELKKIGQQALTSARASVGAKRHPIDITDREWEAIQAGAISENKLSKILNNTDLDEIKRRATPRATTTLSPAKISKIKHMQQSGYTTSEIAESIGVSSSTITKYMKGEE
jgi:predicted transcriptional regulator